MGDFEKIRMNRTEQSRNSNQISLFPSLAATTCWLVAIILCLILIKFALNCAL